MGVDTRGVERGKCTKCTCEEYQLENGSTRAACSYCECPAPAHEVISVVGEKQNSSLAANTSGLSSDVENSIILDIPSCTDMVNQLLNAASSSTLQLEEPTTDEIEKHFPKRFPKKVTTALESKSLKATHKTTMVQKVVDNLYGSDLTSNKCLKKAAKRMVQRWSPLKVHGDTENKGLVDKMRRRRDRLNETGSKKSASSTNGDAGEQLTPHQAKQKMKEHWILGERDVSTYRSNMAICRELRRDECKRLPGLQLLRGYPCLNLHDLVLEEFELEMGMKVATMEAKWTQSVVSLMQYMSDNRICIQSGSLGEKTLCILEHLHRIPLWYKKTFDNNRAARVLEVFEAATPLAEMMPKAKDPPRLLVHGRETGSSISCYLDTEPLFCVDDPVKGLLLLLAVYYVMGIKFPPHTRLQLIVLCCSTVGATAANLSVEIARNHKLIDFLKEVSLM